MYDDMLYHLTGSAIIGASDLISSVVEPSNTQFTAVSDFSLLDDSSSPSSLDASFLLKNIALSAVIEISLSVLAPSGLYALPNLSGVTLAAEDPAAVL